MQVTDRSRSYQQYAWYTAMMTVGFPVLYLITRYFEWPSNGSPVYYVFGVLLLGAWFIYNIIIELERHTLIQLVILLDTHARQRVPGIQPVIERNRSALELHLCRLAEDKYPDLRRELDSIVLV